MGKIVKLGDMSRNPELDECTKLDALFGEPLTITGFKTIQVGANNCAIIATKEKGKVSSFSNVVIEQLGRCQAVFDAGDEIHVKATREKNYYTLTDV